MMRDARTYRGMSAPQRVMDRRERLLAVALTRFSTDGYPATTIEMLCTDAKVSTRGFYECFEGRESLLSALYERIITAAADAVQRAVAASDGTVPGLIHAGLAAYIGYMTDDERRARVSHVEVRRAGDPLHLARRQSVQRFADVITAIAGDGVGGTAIAGLDELGAHRLVVGLLGAVQELLIDWVYATPRPTSEEVVATAEYLFLAAVTRNASA